MPSIDQHPINLLNAQGAPDFVTSDPKALLELAVQNFELATGRTLSPSQVETYLLETVAYMLSVRGAEEQLAFQQCFIAHSEGDALDRHGQDRNTPRLVATPALTSIRFSATAPAPTQIRIPTGTRVSDPSGLITFLTQDVGYLEAGQHHVDIAAEAATPGLLANGFPIGSIDTLVDPIVGISSIINISETGNGADREDDAHYRVRLAEAFERIGYGLNHERYVADVLGWNARCVDVDVSRPQPGHVNISPLMDDGAPNAEELAALQAIFDESLIHQGDYIQTFAPTAHDFSVPLTLILSDPAAEAPARAAVQAVFDKRKQSLGGYVAPSELIRAAKEPVGVVNADVPGLALTEVLDTEWRRGTITNIPVQVI